MTTFLSMKDETWNYSLINFLTITSLLEEDINLTI
jgi:hypothetical protein